MHLSVVYAGGLRIKTGSLLLDEDCLIGQLAGIWVCLVFFLMGVGTLVG